jgi:hypothetical protein
MPHAFLPAFCHGEKPVRHEMSPSRQNVSLSKTLHFAPPT